MELDQTYVAGTYKRFPVEIVSGKGSRVTDANGKTYVDMGSGIGVTAFGIAVYWCTSVEKTAGRETSLMEIWHRFPKFVIGFLTASIIFSIYSADLGPDLGTALINKGVIDGIEKGVRTWFFVLAFTAIGLSTNFRELAPYFKGGKPLILYVCGQSFNLALTLLMAYVMFYLVFPEITAKI